MTNHTAERPNRRSFLRQFYLVASSLAAGLPFIASASTPPSSASATPRDVISAGGLSGRALDLATDQPVPGALVTVTPLGATTTTDLNGNYVVSLPVGTYAVEVAAPGYIGTTRLNQTVGVGSTSLDLNLIPSHPSPDQESILYQRLVKQTVSPLIDADALQRARSYPATTSLPTTITVYYDTGSPPYTVQVPLEGYVKGVIPNEVPATWPASTLQAQAVAARSFGVASQLAYGFVYPDTRSQVYNPNFRTATTDAAVDFTAGQVVTYQGAVIFAFFFSLCNGLTTHNSENATIWQTDGNGNLVVVNGKYVCISAGWNVVGYCRARGCTGHAPYAYSDCGYNGHGVGLCQWGAYYRGNSETYQQILGDYYTNTSYASIATPTPTRTFTPLPTATPTITPTITPTPTPTPIPAPRPLGPWFALPSQYVLLSWTSVGSGAIYTFALYRGNTTIIQPSITTGTTYFVGQLALGTYTWTVKANNGSIMATATLQIVNKIFQSTFPLIGKG